MSRGVFVGLILMFVEIDCDKIPGSRQTYETFADLRGNWVFDGNSYKVPVTP